MIKAKDKTRAAQRKGALTNWKKTGRTLIKYLRYSSKKSKKWATLKQEEGYKWRRSSSRVLGA